MEGHPLNDMLTQLVYKENSKASDVKLLYRIKLDFPL
jgi:hypothetical protein